MKNHIEMKWTREKAIMFFTDISKKDLEKMTDEELFSKGREMGLWKEAKSEKNGGKKHG